MDSGLVILEPPDGVEVNDVAVVISGLAPPGSTVTRVVPFWFDEHVVADENGRWEMAVLLFPGENVFTFRLDGDVATDITYTLVSEPLP